MSATIVNFPDGLTDEQRRRLTEGLCANYMGTGSSVVLQEKIAALPQARSILQRHISLHKSSTTHTFRRVSYWVTERHQATFFNEEPTFAFHVGIYRRQSSVPYLESTLDYVYRIDVNFQLTFESLQVLNSFKQVIA